MAKRTPRKSTTPDVPNLHMMPKMQKAEPLRLPAWIGVGAIVAAVIWIYWPAFNGGWIWDDDWYIPGQPLVRDWHSLWSTWFVMGSWLEYYPLEETLLTAEWHLWHNHTLGYHLVTVAFHIGNALLVWRLLAKLGLGQAWLGGLLFAVHPVAVDSVAWVAETKNTLSTLFCLLVFCAWVDFDARRRPRHYALALFCFLCALLSKISVVPLPAVLVLYVWWKHRRIGWRDVLAVVPFFAIALVLDKVSFYSGALHIHNIPSPADETEPVVGLVARLALSGQTLAVYLTHLVWPVGLLPNYPQWSIDAGSPLAYVPALAFAAAFFALWYKRAEWGGAALLGVCFFLIFVGPFLGLIIASYMGYTWIMDHFLYVGMIGPIGLFVAALESIESRTPREWRVALIGAVTLIVTLLAFESRTYASVYSDEATFWSYTVEHNPGDWVARDNLGQAFFRLGQYDDAVPQLRAAVLLTPGRAQSHFNLGRSLVALGQVPEGIAQYDAALALTPNDADLYNQKAVALLQAGRNAEAIAELKTALRLRPGYPLAMENMGIALGLDGRVPEAIDCFRACLAAKPFDPNMHLNLGRALRQLGRTSEADAEFRAAEAAFRAELKVDPGNAEAQAGLDSLGQQQGSPVPQSLPVSPPRN